MRGVLKSSIAIAIFEEFHAAAGLPIVVGAAGVIVHFADPKFTVGSPIDRDRILDERFGGD